MIRWCLFFLLVLPAAAGEFESANELYEKGEYVEAADKYRVQLKAGESAALYFNLGNALFQAGDFGQGIYCFRQAYRMSPRDPDIRANLRFSRKEVAGAFAPEETGWRVFFRYLSPGEWKLTVAGSAALLFGLLGLAELLRRQRGGLVWPIRILAIATPGFLLLAWVGHQAWDASDEAVLVVAKADVRYGPLKDSKPAYILRNGEEVKITGTKNEWRQVVNTSGQTGWIQGEYLQRIETGLPAVQ